MCVSNGAAELTATSENESVYNSTGMFACHFLGSKWNTGLSKSESWTLRKNEETRLDAFEMKGL